MEGLCQTNWRRPSCEDGWNLLGLVDGVEERVGAGSVSDLAVRVLHFRSQELDCGYEAICENCSFFQTSMEFPERYPSTR